MGMTHVGLFEGSGIPSLCAREAGFKTICQVENDPCCLYCLKKLWPDAMHFDDVRTADWSLITEPVTLLSAGVPCQPVSCAGKQKGENDERWLWPETVRAVRELRPAWLLFENPPSIRLHGLERIAAELEALGYDFIPKGPDGRFTPLCVGAWAVGAPHRRNRVWIVGRLADSRIDANRNAAGQVAKRGRNGTKNRTADVSQGKEWRAHQSDAIPGNADSSDGLEHAGQKLRRARRDDRDGREGLGVETASLVERSGETVADAANHNGRCGIGETEERVGPEEIGWRRLASGSVELADDQGNGCRPSGTESAGFVGQSIFTNVRWPSRPGQPQHDWEAPRLVELPLGGTVNGLARRVRKAYAGGVLRLRDCDPDLQRGLASAILRRTNKAMLRALGNGWVFDLPLFIYQWIADQEYEPKGE